MLKMTKHQIGVHLELLIACHWADHLRFPGSDVYKIELLSSIARVIQRARIKRCTGDPADQECGCSLANSREFDDLCDAYFQAIEGLEVIPLQKLVDEHQATLGGP